MKHTATLTVRSYECDSYNHVNNAVYLNYLEFARMEFLRAIDFDYEGIIAAGYYLYVTHVDIYYKASAVLGDRLLIDEWHMSQFSGVLLYLPVLLFERLTGGTDGIYLAFR